MLKLRRAVLGSLISWTWCISLVAACGGLLAPAGAAAQAFPSKPLRIIVPSAPGGAADASMRIVGQALGKRLGQQVLIENRPGADGIIAAQAVAGAPPDGYTLLMGTNTAMVAVPALRPNPPYDPFKAFTPISSAGQFTIFLVVPATLPVKSAKELLDLVAAHPGKYNSASSNSASELAMLQLLGEREVVNARYKGDSPAFNDLVGGQIQMMFSTAVTARAFVRDGKARALLTAQPQRSAVLPEVPTAAELGFGSLTITPWVGFFGPAGMPAPLVERLSGELQQVLAQADVREQLAGVGFEGYGMAPAKFAEYYRQQYDSFVKLVREKNLKFE
ncbi:MAG TPA: tripartite tricarboxylate transporter substrate binding protein [Ideonella sp.]|nr:tripartite tricarboxylate transporter substrate binding protein [Ideonella sp.]